MDLHCPLVLPVQFLFASNFGVVKSLLFAVLFISQKKIWYHCLRRSPEWILHQKSPVKLLLRNLFKEAVAAEIFHQGNGISLPLGKPSKCRYEFTAPQYWLYSQPVCGRSGRVSSPAGTLNLTCRKTVAQRKSKRTWSDYPMWAVGFLRVSPNQHLQKYVSALIIGVILR